MDSLTAVVERITYYNEENGYCVLRVRPESRVADAEARDGTVVVVGTLPDVKIGESFEFEGYWTDNDRYGKQFRAELFTAIMPATDEGLIAYLGSGVFKGIGPITAERIVKKFGKKTLDVLDHHPERLKEVIKPKLAEDLAESWRANQVNRRIMIYLQGLGISPKMAVRIIGTYGSETIPTMESNPFALADEVFGIGFIRADDIARRKNIAPDDPNRIRAGISYALNQLAKEGNVYAPRALLVEKTRELLRVENSELIEQILGQELFKTDLIADPTVTDSTDPADEAVYLKDFWYAEKGAAQRIRRLINTPSKITERAKTLNWSSFLADLAERNHVELTEQQQGAVKAALTNKVSILTGGPGTGKTTTLKMVIEALLELDFEFDLASPTGRAAKRLSEATEQPARTIHRLLGYLPGEGFTYDEDNPLDIDMLIVDESSMIDILLFSDLLSALKSETHLLLVGDVDQLPSVGAGNVLRDMIDSGAAFVTRLTNIFRQAETSHIVVNAHRINHGEAPYSDNNSADFFISLKDDPADAAQEIVTLVRDRIPARFGVDPLNDVQVIAPMYRGMAGVNALNELLQKALNGDKRTMEKKIGDRLFRVGDKVMQTKNNYEKDVFNGDIGRLIAIDPEKHLFTVVVDDRYVEYDWTTEADQLIHAYCISTHRSQGSEYPVVVMPVLTQHYMMLQRNLLYTAVTRAKKVVVLVGSRKAIEMAVKNNKVSQRFSGLRQRLQTRTER